MLWSREGLQLFSSKWVTSFFSDSIAEVSNESFSGTASRSSRGLKAKGQARCRGELPVRIDWQQAVEVNHPILIRQ